MDVGWRRVGAYALCLDAGQILLTRFAFSGHPDSGKWTLPGGGMEWQESPRQTAAREFHEETGLSAQIGDVVGVYSRWYTPEESVRGSSGHFVALVYAANGVSGALRSTFDGLDTTDGAAWFPIDGLDDVPHVELVDFAVGLNAHQPES